MEHFSYKLGMVWCILRHLKEELAWAIDKQLTVISNIMLFETVSYVEETKEYSH